MQLTFNALKIGDKFTRQPGALVWTKIDPVRVHPRVKPQNCFTRQPPGPTHYEYIADDVLVYPVEVSNEG